MGKKKGSSGGKGAQQRTRKNPITGAIEMLGGTKAGRKRQRLSIGDPLRTHDLRAPTATSRKKKKNNKLSK